MDWSYRRMQSLTSAVAVAAPGERVSETLDRAAAFLEWLSVDEPLDSKVRNLPPRTQAWLKRNPECLTNVGLYQKMGEAAFAAANAGIPAESDAYFTFIEQRLGLNKPRIVSITPTDRE